MSLVRLGIVAVVLAGCVIGPAGTFGAGKSRQQVVHEQAAQLTPTRLHAVGSYAGDIQTKKIRVWADDDYRAQNVHWQQGFQQILDDANDILGPQFGIRLTPEFVDWPYREPPGAEIETALADLMQHDPERDAFCVVGLISSISLVTASFDKIGYAQVPGRYLVVRGYSDIHERKALEQSFEDLRKDERSLMFDARKHHKRLALLLHELGHTFGAEHASVPSSVMAPSYSVQSTEFDDTSRTQIMAQLDARLGRASLTASSKTPNAPATTPDPPKPKPVERPPLKLDPKDKTPVIVIVVDADGKRLIDGEPIADAQLDGIFLLAHDKNKLTRVYVRRDPESPPAVVQDVVDRAKRGKLTRVIVTDD